MATHIMMLEIIFSCDGWLHTGRCCFLGLHHIHTENDHHLHESRTCSNHWTLQGAMLLSRHNWKYAKLCCDKSRSLDSSMYDYNPVANKWFQMVYVDILWVTFALIYTVDTMQCVTAASILTSVCNPWPSRAWSTECRYIHLTTW